MGEMERIEAQLNAIQDKLKAKEASEMATLPAPAGLLEEDISTAGNSCSPYQITLLQQNPLPLSVWVERNGSDPAIKVCELLCIFYTYLTMHAGLLLAKIGLYSLAQKPFTGTTV